MTSTVPEIDVTEDDDEENTYVDVEEISNDESVATLSYTGSTYL